MAFKGINSSLQQKINNWHLPASIIDGFVNGLRVLSQLSPKYLPYDDKGLFFTIDVDGDIAGGHTFQLRLARNDQDFWVRDVHCFEVNGAGEIIWTSDGFTM